MTNGGIREDDEMEEDQPASRWLPAGGRIGRFPVLEKLGDGPMGVVYAGYDDRLDRRVALRVLHAGPREEPIRAQRLWRDAQAMARLSHPNVVTVHEVVQVEGTVCVVMEFVRGQTLTRWLHSEPSWEAVLQAFVAAGEGLEAAHELGMVHRDFKPSKVMRGEDGAVKVLDFGRAKVAGGRATTPYMSPEQQEGAEVDARSDQYSFCVAAWACLTGGLPFGSGATQAVLQAKLRGPPRWPKGAPTVPGRVVDALRRGLAADPEDRWGSMQRLLAELRWDPRQRRRQWSLGLAGVTLASVGGLAAQSWAGQRSERCSGASDKLVGVWDATRKAEAKAARLQVKQADVTQAWADAEAKLDAYAGEWEDMHIAACEAGVNGDAGPALDARMRCLHRLRLGLEATVDTLVDADAQVVDKAREVVAGLRPLRWCADENALSADQEPPLPREEAAVARARKAMSRSSSERSAGRIDAARAALEEANVALADVQYGRVLAERALEAAKVYEENGQYQAAEASYTEGLELAFAHGSQLERFEVTLGLLGLVGDDRGRPVDGLRYWPFVEALSRGNERHMALALERIAILLNLEGRAAEAEVKLREAIRLKERVFGPENVPPRVRANFAATLLNLGRYREAEVEFRAARRTLEATRGLEHPLAVSIGMNLVATVGSQGRHEEAELECRKTLQLSETVLGPEHPNTARLRLNLGVVLLTQGRLEEAEAQLRSAVEGIARAHGFEHLHMANVRGNLGSVFVFQGRYEDAKTEYLESLRVCRKMLGDVHPEVATRWKNLGSVEKLQGNYAQAEANFLTSLRIRKATLAADHPDLASSYLGLADLKCEQGLFDEAYPLALKAWERYRRGDLAPNLVGDAAFVLARSLWSMERPSRDRSRAREMARNALRWYRADHGDGAKKIREAETWLAEHAL